MEGQLVISVREVIRIKAYFGGKITSTRVNVMLLLGYKAKE